MRTVESEDTTIESKSIWGNRYIRAVPLGAAALLLAGCGSLGGGKKASEQGIPNCPDGTKTLSVIHNQYAVVRAFESAEQNLAIDHTSRGRNTVNVAVAFRQIFNVSSSSGLGVFKTTATEPLTSNANLYNDPAELMCQLDQPGEKQKATVLSAGAIQAEIILAKSGNPVHIPKNAVG